MHLKSRNLKRNSSCFPEQRNTMNHKKFFEKFPFPAGSWWLLELPVWSWLQRCVLAACSSSHTQTLDFLFITPPSDWSLMSLTVRITGCFMRSSRGSIWLCDDSYTGLNLLIHIKVIILLKRFQKVPYNYEGSNECSSSLLNLVLDIVQQDVTLQNNIPHVSVCDNFSGMVCTFHKASRSKWHS